MKKEVSPLMLSEDHLTESGYVLVAKEVLPEVFGKVLLAKELLANGSAKNISSAVRQADLSRSAFYKYKDCVYRAAGGSHLLVLQATLVNEPGTLQSLLALLSAQGIDVVTIHQQKPNGATADVTLTLDVTELHGTAEQLLNQLRTKPFIHGLEVLDG